jgi:hypothetical protein
MTGPAGIGSIVPRNEAWIIKELKDIKRQIAQLRTARVGNRMTVDGKPGIAIQHGGGITVYDGGAFTLASTTGQVVLLAATTNIPDGSGRTQQSFTVGRDDGTTAFYVTDAGTTPGHPHQQNWALLDRTQNIVVAEDTVSGAGLARPWLSLGQWDDQSAPTSTTTSSTYVTLATMGAYRQHPRIAAQCLARTSDSTTAGSLQLLANGTAIATATVAAGTFAYVNFPIATLPAGTFGDALTLQIQGRRTAGTGTIGVRGSGAFGVQS